MIMMKRETIAIADICVPIKRRATLEQKRVDEIAASILDKGLQSPILVRADGARFVLVDHPVRSNLRGCAHGGACISGLQIHGIPRAYAPGEGRLVEVGRCIKS